MVTETMMEAIDTLIAACSSYEQRLGMESVRDMLSEFSDSLWIFDLDSDSKQCEWVEQFLNCDHLI